MCYIFDNTVTRSSYKQIGMQMKFVLPAMILFLKRSMNKYRKELMVSVKKHFLMGGCALMVLIMYRDVCS